MNYSKSRKIHPHHKLSAVPLSSCHSVCCLVLRKLRKYATAALASQDTSVASQRTTVSCYTGCCCGCHQRCFSKPTPYILTHIVRHFFILFQNRTILNCFFKVMNSCSHPLCLCLVRNIFLQSIISLVVQCVNHKCQGLLLV